MQINGTCTRDSDCPQQDDKCLISYCSDGECKVQPKVPKRVFSTLALFSNVPQLSLSSTLIKVKRLCLLFHCSKSDIAIYFTTVVITL